MAGHLGSGLAVAVGTLQKVTGPSPTHPLSLTSDTPSLMHPFAAAEGALYALRHTRTVCVERQRC